MSHKWFREMKFELQRSGITVIDMEHGRKHMKVRITNGKVSGFITTAVSPSDWRAIRKVVHSAKLCLARQEEGARHG